MCLRSVRYSKSVQQAQENPTIFIGWKVMRYNEATGAYYTPMVRKFQCYIKNKWYTAKDNGFWSISGYKPGFHVFRDKVDAVQYQRNMDLYDVFKVIQVEYRYILAAGVQLCHNSKEYTIDCDVAHQMRVVTHE